MSDESQLRELLSYVTEPPEHVQPPVRHLIELGRKHRRRRVASWTTAVSTVTAVAVVAPFLALGIDPAGPGQGQPGHGMFGFSPAPVTSGPTAVQLTKFRWSELPKSPFRRQQPDVVARAGRELLEIGRRIHRDPSLTVVFDPGTGRWHQAGRLPNGVDAANAAVAWTGHLLFVTDGRVPLCGETSAPQPGLPERLCDPRAGLYDPLNNRWTTTVLPKAMFGLQTTAATWTGRAVVLTGLTQGRHPRIGVAAYFPATGRWRVITPKLPEDHIPDYVTATATRDRLLLWVMWQRPGSARPRADAGVDVLAVGDTGGWRPVKGWPKHRSLMQPSFTGSELLIPIGHHGCYSNLECSHEFFDPGFFADPVSLHRTPIPKTAMDDYGAGYLWAGRAIIEVNGQGSSSPPSLGAGETLAYDPVARHWRQLRSIPSGEFLTGVVWTGAEVLALDYQGQLFALHR